MKSKAPTGALQTVTANGVVKVSAHLWFKAHLCSLDLYANRCAPFKHHCPHAAYVCVCVLCGHAAHPQVDRGWQCWNISVAQTSTCPISWLTFWRSLLLCPAAVPALMCCNCRHICPASLQNVLPFHFYYVFIPFAGCMWALLCNTAPHALCWYCSTSFE